MEELLEHSAKYYFTDLFQATCALIAGVIGYLNRFKFRGVRFLFLYPVFSFVQHGYALLISNLPHNTLHEELYSNNFSVNIFLILEFLSFYYFYFASKNGKKFQAIYLSILVLYVLSTVHYWTSYGPTYTPIPFYLVQSIFILVISILGLIELFAKPAIQTLLNEPKFWISVGVFAYFLGTLPLFLAENFIFDKEGYLIEQAIYSINFIMYAFLFLFLIRGFLCKPIET